MGEGAGHGPAPVSLASGPAAAVAALPNPRPVDLAYGLGIFKLDNLIGHNGAAIGYSSAMFYLPSNGATLVVWGNNSTNSSTPATTIAFDIAEILFPKAVDEGGSYGPLPAP